MGSRIVRPAQRLTGPIKIIMDRRQNTDLILEVANSGLDQDFETFHRALNEEPRILTGASVPMWRMLRMFPRDGVHSDPYSRLGLLFFQYASERTIFGEGRARRAYNMGWRAVVSGPRVTRCSVIHFRRTGVILYYSDECAYAAPCA